MVLGERFRARRLKSNPRSSSAKSFIARAATLLMPTSSLVILGLEIGGPITYLLSERCARGDSPILPGGGPWGTQYERVAFCAGPELQHLMTTDDVDPSGHVGDQPLPVIYVPAVPHGSRKV
jgi:hypothetical protein